MGPFKAIRNYLENHPDADHLHVTLYGSLAATGKGHLTDKAIEEAFHTWKMTDRETLESKDKRSGDVTIEWKPKENLELHPNGMKVASVNFDGDLYDKWTYYSVGGGDIICMEHPLDADDEAEVYEMNTMKEILDWCNRTGKAFWEFVAENEADTPGFWEHLELVWKVMQKAVERGIDEEGALPGDLNLRRKAGSYYIKADGYGDVLRTRSSIISGWRFLIVWTFTALPSPTSLEISASIRVCSPMVRLPSFRIRRPSASRLVLWSFSTFI